MIRLNAEWSQLFATYAEEHQDPRNQACHRIGIPLIAASLPIGATIIGLPLAAAMFTTGWGFQFVGHYFEGKPPSLLKDKRMSVVGLLWCLKKSGMNIEVTEPATPATPATPEVPVAKTSAKASSAVASAPN
ncbi:MAG: hypothetical protein JWM74_6067 [Myxococcaceae bacterium]|jgi:uncharacterized membrane protein YGL010W|nr:hypothetical protein [Myxococcaceae bacterium]